MQRDFAFLKKRRKLVLSSLPSVIANVDIAHNALDPENIVSHVDVDADAYTDDSINMPNLEVGGKDIGGVHTNINADIDVRRINLKE